MAGAAAGGRRARRQPRATLQGRIYALLAVITLVLLAVVSAMAVTLSRFQDDANYRDRLAAAMPDLGRVVQQPFARESQALLERDEAMWLKEPAVSRQYIVARIAVMLAGAPDATDATRALARAELATLVDDAERAVDYAIAAGTDSRNVFIGSVGLATVSAAVLLILGSVALRQWVVVPIGRIHDDIDAVGDGDLHHAITPTGARDLAELAAAAERMRTRLLRARDAIEKADEAVLQDAPAVAALRRLLAPAVADTPPGLDVAAILLPAEGVLAGDWYDMVRVEDHLLIGIGDVCGHGASTGIAAVRTKFALLDAMHLGMDPSEALGLAASRFGESSEFVTCLVVDCAPSGQLRYANAGHPPALRISQRGEVASLDPTGLLIGPFPETWQSREAILDVGDTLVLYSDGLTECRDDGGSGLGTDAVVRAVTAAADASAATTLDAIISALFRHCPDGLVDDVTIVVARRVS